MQCQICHEKFELGEDVKTHNSNATGDTVTHLFHKGCLEKWYQRSENCPICRDQIPWEE